MGASYLKARLQGNDPVRSVAPNARYVSPDVAMSFMVPELAQRKAEVDMLAQSHDGLKLSTKSYDTLMELWTERNKAPLGLFNPFAPPETQAGILEMFQKVEIPDEMGTQILQGLNDFAMKAREIDPDFDLNSDPRTAHIAKAMSEAVDRYGEGALMSGAAPENAPEATSAAGRTFRAGMYGVQEVAGGFFGTVADGLTQLGFLLAGGLDSEWYQAYRKEIEGQVFVDKKGNLVSTSRRVGWEGPYLSYKLLTGMQVDGIAAEVEKLNDAKNFDRSQVDQEGMEAYANAVSSGLGSIAGFMMSGGGQFLHYGVKGAAAVLASKGAKTGLLRKAITASIGNGIGAAAHNIGAYGRFEDYGHLALEGMKLGPIFAAAGGLGRRLEQMLGRAKMPAAVKRVTAGMFEGAVLHAGELTDLNSSLWNVMRDPTPENVKEWSKNITASVLSMGMFKGITGKTPFETKEMERLFGEGAPQVRAAEKVADTRRGRPVEEIVEAEGVSPETAQTYTESVRQTDAVRGEERIRASKAEQAVQRRVETEAKGRHEGPVETLEKKVAKGPQVEIVGREGRLPIAKSMAEGHRQEIQDLRQQLKEGTVDKRAANRRILELIDQGGEVFRRQVEEYVGELRVADAPSEGRQKEFAEATRYAKEFFVNKRGKRLADPKPGLGKREFKEEEIERYKAGEEPPEKWGDTLIRIFEEAPEAIRAKEQKVAYEAEEAQIEQRSKEVGRSAALREAREERERGSAAKEQEARIYEEHTPEAGKRRGEQVEGAEGQPAPSTEAESRRQRRIEREATEQGFDPLEDPNFMDRPEGERRRILDRREGIERRREAEAIDLERRGGPRRLVDRRMKEEASDIQKLDISQVPEGRKGRPKSLDIQPSLQLEQAREGVPLTRPSDLTKRMEGLPTDPFQVAMRPGDTRVSEKSLGWYNTKENLARFSSIKLPGIRAHEWSHSFDRDLRKKGIYPDLSQPLQVQLVKAAETYPDIYNQSQRFQQSEGWAEFWARYMLEDPRLPKDVPELYRHMSEWISQPEMAPYERFLRDLQEIVRNEIEMGAVERGFAEVRMLGDPKTKTEKQTNIGVARKLWRMLNHTMVDAKHDWRRVERDILKREGIDRESLPMRVSPVDMHDAMLQKARRMTEQFLKNTFDVEGRTTGVGLRNSGIAQASKKVNRDWINYILAKRSYGDIKAHELKVAKWEAGGQIGPQPKEFKTIRSKEDYLYRIKHFEEIYPEFPDYVREVRDIATRLLDYSEEAGAITAEEKARMIKNNPVYMTMMREMATPDLVRPTGKKNRETGAGIMPRRGGSEMEVRDPWQAIEEVTYNTILKANQAKVMNALFLQQRLISGLGPLATEVKPGVEAREVLMEEVAKRLMKIGEKMKMKEPQLQELADMLEEIVDGSSAEAMVFFFQSSVPKGSKPVIAMRPKYTEAGLAELGLGDKQIARMMQEVGKLKFLEIDADIYNNMMTLDGAPSWVDLLPPIIGTPMRVSGEMIRFGATTMSAGFALRNPLRDVATRQLYTKVGANKFAFFSGYGDFIKGAIETLSRNPSPTVQQLRNLGLESSTFLGSDLAHDMAGQQASIWKSVVRKTADVLGATESFNRMREGVEVTERLRAEGKSEFEAIHRGLLAGATVTGPFFRTGSIAKQFRMIEPYFTSNIAGLSQMWRTMTGEQGPAAQRQMIIRGVTNIGGLSALIWLWHHKDEWWQDQPVDQRINNWIFKFPGTDEVVRLPKNFQPGIIFGTGLEILLSTVDGFDSELAEDAALEFVKDHLVGYPFMFNVTRPANEGRSNWSFWRGSPIYREKYPGEPPSEQYLPSTTELFKAIGAAMNISPAKAEYVVDQYGGGLPVAALRFIEGMMGLREIAPGGQIPGIGWFTSPSEHKRSRAVDDLYRIRDEVKASARGSYERNQQEMVDAAIDRLAAVRQRVQTGNLEKEAGDRMMFEIANPVVKQFRSGRR